MWSRPLQKYKWCEHNVKWASSGTTTVQSLTFIIFIMFQKIAVFQVFATSTQLDCSTLYSATVITARIQDFSHQRRIYLTSNAVHWYHRGSVRQNSWTVYFNSLKFRMFKAFSFFFKEPVKLKNKQENKKWPHVIQEQNTIHTLIISQRYKWIHRDISGIACTSQEKVIFFSLHSITTAKYFRAFQVSCLVFTDFQCPEAEKLQRELSVFKSIQALSGTVQTLMHELIWASFADTHDSLSLHVWWS